jgi:hypothetical protein
MDMKYCFLVLIGFFLFFEISFAQPKHDYIWMFGDEGTDTLHSGLSLINFNQSLIEIKKVPYTGLNTKIYVSNTTMSDADGNLAFYTNGCAIYNTEHQVMENGDEINPGDVHDDYCDAIGYPNGKQTCLALPWPDSSKYYILFHQPSEIISVPPFGFDIICPLLYYSIIDLDQADGLGEVEDKNHIIVEDTLYAGQIAAVKHANGRDWWVLVPERQSARYHTLVVTPHGVVDTFSQEIGIPFIINGEGTGQAAFSPNGLKYMRYTYRDGVHLFDFDRQTGVLSNFQHIPGTPDIGSFGGAAFSPSGQYLYTISLSDYLYQYDLWASDIAASKTLVAEYDGYKENNFWSTDFGDMQLGPDCRIYIATNPNTSYLHVIDNPDNPSLEVNVIQRAVKLPAKHQGLAIPNFPNYRLDSIATYPCDSNIVLIPHDPSWVWEQPATTEKLQAWPNPSAGNFTLSLPRTAGRLVVFDPLGREIWRRELGGYESEIEVEAASWAPGLYHCAFVGEDGRVFTTFILIQHH